MSKAAKESSVTLNEAIAELDSILHPVARDRFVQREPLSTEECSSIWSQRESLPSDYVDFVIHFEKFQAFRKCFRYQLHVHAPPFPTWVGDKQALLLARTDSSQLYSLGRAANNHLVTGVGPAMQNYSGTFIDWVVAAAKRIRKSYRAAEWEELLRAPRPFSEHELAILNARRQMSVRLVRSHDGGEVEVEVTNASPITLPFLTIGYRYFMPSALFAYSRQYLYLDVSTVSPGATKIASFTTHRGVVPSAVELVRVEDPTPSDRQCYWEFKEVDRST